jgi:DNA-binding NarL/FixJ family response regulator
VIRILVADNQEVVRYGLRKILERQQGWEVVAEASNGKDAIRTAFETTPNVAILDYALPVINGAEATRHIRARLPNTEVLIFTAYHDDILVHECLEAGARSYLLKSATERQLLSAVEFAAMRKPFVTGKLAETLLHSFLASPRAGAQLIAPRHNLPAPTQRSVLQLVAEGYTEEHIADRLKMSLKLVRALVNALRNGLIEP